MGAWKMLRYGKCFKILVICAILNVSILMIFQLKYSRSWTYSVYKNVFIGERSPSARAQVLSSVNNVIETKLLVANNDSHHLRVQRIFTPVNCTKIVNDKNAEEIEKADAITRAYREYRDGIKGKEIGSQEFMDDLMMIPDENFIFDQSRCDEFITIRGYNNYTVSQEEMEFPLAFSMLTYEHAEQFERLLRVIYRPQNAYCIHVDAKSNKTFQNAVKSIVQCFPNVFIATKQEEVYLGKISRLNADINCIRDFMMAAPNVTLPFDAKAPENVAKFWSHENMKNKTFRHDWKYLFTMASTEFPIRTNRELVQILKIFNGTNDVDFSDWKSVSRVEINKSPDNDAGHLSRVSLFKSPPPFNYTVVKGTVYSTLSRAFTEYVMTSIEARSLLAWIHDLTELDELYWATLHYSINNKAPGIFESELPDKNSHYMTTFMGWSEMYRCDDAGRRLGLSCVLTNGDLNYVTHLPHFFMNKFLLNDDPVAYTCVEDWYARRHARENELTSKGEKQVIDMTPYCQYLNKVTGRIYRGCESFNTNLTSPTDKKMNKIHLEN